MYLVNAFSINMFPGGEEYDLKFERLTLEDAQMVLSLNRWSRPSETVINAIGHKDTDRVVRRMLNLPWIEEGQRVNVDFPMDRDTDQQLLVAQLRGTRLPEGATELPEGATIEWWLVTSFA